MGSGFRTNVRLATRATAVAVAVAAFTPSYAHADLWCVLFNSGCGGGGSSNTTRQARPDRSTPEIDPGTMAGALALAVGGAALLSDRVRRRR